MRSILVVGLAAALVAAPEAPSAPTVATSLRLVKLTPLTLRGTGFQSGERVRVTLSFRRYRSVRSAQADGRGRFTIRYTVLLALEPCRGTLVVTAVGSSSGRRATFKRACRPPDPLP